MKQSRTQLARRALASALEIRRRTNEPISEPICIYDLVKAHGIEIWFIKAPSMEGIYSKETGPIILINSERPPGRQVFTCAHEFGHHVFNHGTQIDEMTNSPPASNPEEFLADCFAGFLLMPKTAVLNAFIKRGWNPHAPKSDQIYIVAGHLGVGTSTLIHHMQLSLKLFDEPTANKLLRIQPKQIRKEILGENIVANLIIADQFWTGRSIDAEVGDVLLVPNGTTFEGKAAKLLKQTEKGAIFEALSPGLGRLQNELLGWSAFVRISKHSFEGRNVYRHLEEADCDQPN